MNYTIPTPTRLDGLAYRRGESARENGAPRAGNPYAGSWKRRSWYAGWERRDREALTADLQGTVNR